jgi:GH15 family glucan-1,4-alpha-glucosidase
MPEQIHKDLGVPISAMPLGWSHAMFIIAVHGDFEILIP